MSPDLNPNEHICNQLKQRLDDGTPPSSDIAELHGSLVEELNASEQHNKAGEEQETLLPSQ